MERDLESYRVGSLPRIYYVPEFISEAQEAQLLCEIRASKFKWTQVSGRRLQNHGGVVHTSGWLIQQQLPSWLQPLAQLTHSSTGVFGSDPPNHVLINSYEPGEGILVGHLPSRGPASAAIESLPGAREALRSPTRHLCLFHLCRSSHPRA